MIRVSPPPPLLLLLSHNKTPPPLGFAAITYALLFCPLLLQQEMSQVTIYGSDLLILSDYAPSMPPLLSLPLSMACDDSDGQDCHPEEAFNAPTNPVQCPVFLNLLCRVTIYGSDLLILLDYAPSMPPLFSLPLPMACDHSDSAMGVVTLLSGQPKEGVSVEARSDLKGSYEETVTDSSGSYRLRGLHPNTSYTIRVVPFSNASDPISRTLFCQDGDHTEQSFPNQEFMDSHCRYTQCKPRLADNPVRRMLRMDACYLELKVLSRSRRDGSCDFLDHYGYHYGDAIARPLLPSEDMRVDLDNNERLRGQRRVNFNSFSAGLEICRRHSYGCP
ncbi:nodal modulator 1 [Tanacetum coccineum]